MSAFTESALVKKLLELNASQQSIQTVSLWVIHHRRHYKTIVAVWLREMRKVNQSKKLTFMYLANDVIQNSKKKGPEYGKEFAVTLKDAFAHVAESCKGEDIFNRLDRILSIWEERGVYESKQIKEWFNALHSISGSGSASATPAFDAAKKRKHDDHPPKVQETPEKKPKSSKTETVEVNGTVETHITLSPQVTQECDPPEPEVLIKFLQNLENSASSDAAVREKIANLPPEVSEMSLLQKLTDKEAAIKLAVQVNDAITLLNEYNARLADEMVERKKLTTMLKDFQTEQAELLAHAEQRLEEYKEKLKKVKDVQKEVHNQLKNLPEIPSLSAPELPSAGDLFRQVT
ncbi:regulation of nuclear pre-mRNA domain-containing protein 1A [Culicoides brevitarsis]|uniref:regulation of nuclear pre-mRNA domain-containing protein 1A n=1 Tax=Culicoides brevitarsis TaxID=469753 RepID=UPI00307BC801